MTDIRPKCSVLSTDGAIQRHRSWLVELEEGPQSALPDRSRSSERDTLFFGGPGTACGIFVILQLSLV